MAHGTCSVDGCANDLKAKGLCGAHRRRQIKGKPLDPPLRGSWRNVTCRAEGCDLGGRMQRGLCATHYSRWRIHGDVQSERPIQVKLGRTVCQVDGCGRKELSRQMCTMHYQRWAKKGSTDPRQKVVPGTCSVDDCDQPIRCRELCTSHYRRLRLHGDPLGSKPRKTGPPVCTVSGCKTKTVARGYCQRHWTRWRNHGDPSVNNARVSKARLGLCRKYRCREPIVDAERCERHYRIWLALTRQWNAAEKFESATASGKNIEALFWERVTPSDGCWTWQGHINPAGYAVCPTGTGQVYILGHRLSWLLAGRKLIKGMHLDHLCHTRDKACPGGGTCPHRQCVNPDHLEQVAPAINVERGRGPSGRNSLKTHCKRGHEFDLINTYFPPSGGRHCRTCIRTVYAEKRRKSAA